MNNNETICLKFAKDILWIYDIRENNFEKKEIKILLKF